jgi:alkylation response protein AidB-like acyl-CoA dehydrogenase
MIDLVLSADQKELLAEFHSFAAEQIAPQADAFDRNEAISAEIVASLAGKGFLGSHIPEEFGGLGLDPIAYGLLHDEVGKACSSVRSLLTVHDMVAEVILRVGSTDQREHWLPMLAGGHVKGAFALTEPLAGSDAAGISATATPTDDGYILSGSKKWISFGQLADVFLVFAHLDKDGPVEGFLVQRDTPGLTIAPMQGLLGMRASMLASLELHNCVIDRDAKVGTSSLMSGLATAAGLNLGRYSVAWGAVAIGEAAVDASLRYSGEREQFGMQIGKHQLIRRLLTNMVTDVRAARLLCLEAGFLIQQRDPGAIQATLIAKYFASQMASRVAGDAVQIHGALGCINGLPVERYFRDARIMEIIEGSNEIMQIAIGGHALREHSGQILSREE